jgi:peptidoglycan/LPS O-acetylase OafA/YrhL
LDAASGGDADSSWPKVIVLSIVEWPPSPAPGAARRSLVSGKTYFVPLTSLRGIAAVLVVLFHAQIFGLAPYFASATMLPVKGYLWVDFFFMLSGFVIAHSYGQQFVAGISRRDLADYLTARFARIYPLHLVMLAAFLGIELARSAIFGNVYPEAHRVGGFGPIDFTTPDFFGQLFLVQAWPFHAHTSWNAPAWSISCETAAYFMFPVLFLALARRGRKLVWLAGLLALATLAALYGLARPHSLDAGYNIIRCGAEFTIGVCLQRLYAERHAAAFLARDAAAFSVAALLILSLHLGLPDLLVVAEFALLLLVAVLNRGAFSAALETRIPEFFGRISYSIYMVHFPVFFVIALAARALGGPEALIGQSPAMRVVLFVPAFALVIGLSTLTYHAIEVPCRKAIMARRRRRVALPDTGGGLLLPADAE